MQAGERIGRYEIQKRLAVGGMAEIFLAKLKGEAGFEKEIVLKKILPQWSGDRDFIAMLVDEAKIAVRLNHSNIVQVYELAREGDMYYIALEYVHGIDLRRLLQRAQAQKTVLPFKAALFIAAEVLEGLAYAHASKDASGKSLNLVHRDVSPQNILLSFDGTVKLTDFGIAKAASRSQETITGVLKGKFAYMSPEQANQEALDGRSDLFSLAVVLYEMLTGERLFYRGADLDTLDRVRRCDIASAAEALKGLPGEIGDLLLKALAKRPEDRFGDARAFRESMLRCVRELGKEFSREDLSRYLASLFPEEGRIAVPVEETMTAARPPVPTHPPGTMRKAKMAGALAVMLSVVLAIGLTIRSQEDPKEEAHLKRESDLKIKETLDVTEVRLVPPEIPVPVRSDQAIAVVAETVPAAPAEPAPVVSLKKAIPPPNGYLSVQAIPWGTVTVDGGRGRETPVRRLALAPGRHVVRVTYAPDGTAVATSVLIKSRGEIVCIAKLRGGKTITCGD